MSNDGGPCRKCGVNHGADLNVASSLHRPRDSFIKVTRAPFEPRDVVKVIATGHLAWVREWSIYGCPMYVRVQYVDADVDGADAYGRGNFAPCELSAAPPLHLWRGPDLELPHTHASCGDVHDGLITPSVELVTCLRCIEHIHKYLAQRYQALGGLGRLA